MGDYYESSKSNLGFRDTSVPYWCSNVLQAFENEGGPLLLLNWQIRFVFVVTCRSKNGSKLLYFRDSKCTISEPSHQRRNAQPFSRLRSSPELSDQLQVLAHLRFIAGVKKIQFLFMDSVFWFGCVEK